MLVALIDYYPKFKTGFLKIALVLIHWSNFLPSLYVVVALAERSVNSNETYLYLIWFDQSYKALFFILNSELSQLTHV